MGHPAQYSGEKQGDSTDDVYGSKSEKKKSTRIFVETNKQTVSVKAKNSKFTTFIGAPCTV